MKQAAILAFLGQTRDRFSEYHAPRSTRERLELLREIPGMDGFEIVYPYETGDPEETRRWADELGLEFAAVNVNIKKELQFVPGALVRPDAGIRRQALDLIRGGKDYAEAVGAPLVTCCPLADGYDYLFQLDYAEAWKRLAGAVAEVADYKPHIPLCLEYKASETRVRCVLDSAAKTLLLCRDVGNPAVGVTLDFGHSIYGSENPAEALSLAAASGHPYYIHLNDNDGRFDWDLVAGSYHLMHMLEFFYYARRLGYGLHFTSDMSPRILGIRKAFELHATACERLWKIAGDLEASKLSRLMDEENTAELLALVRDTLVRP